LGDGVPQVATADVTVNGEDVDGVRLSVTRMIVVSGRIVVADPAAAQTLRPNNLRLMPSPATPDDSMFMMGPGPGGTVKEDFSFEMRTMPGKMVIRVAGPMQGWQMKAVRLNGLDVTDSGIDFTPGSDVSGIEVELTNRLSELSGLVANARGEAVKDYSVIV